MGSLRNAKKILKFGVGNGPIVHTTDFRSQIFAVFMQIIPIKRMTMMMMTMIRKQKRKTTKERKANQLTKPTKRPRNRKINQSVRP